MSFHLNPETGNPNKCTANKRACPFGGASDHYSSKAEARIAYEESQAGPHESAKKKVLPLQYELSDSFLPGMGRGPSAATLQKRADLQPQLSFEDRQVSGNWVTDVYANGRVALTVTSRDEAVLVARATEAGQWPALKAAMSNDSASCEEVIHLLTYQADELSEELDYRIELLKQATEAQKSDVRSEVQAVAIAGLARAVHAHEAHASKNS